MRGITTQTIKISLVYIIVDILNFTFEDDELES